VRDKDDSVRLIQEDYIDDPWKMMVACILLNRTTGTQVKKVLPLLFERYPSARVMAMADIQQLTILISGLGLENIRALRLKAMSALWGTRPLTQLPGIGRYAIDSYVIFIEGRTDIQPSDKMLQKYLDTKKSPRGTM